MLKRMTGDRVFRAATVSALALLVLFFVGILASMLGYTDWHTFVTTLFSSEILFAIRLSLTTATLATAISMAIAVPAAYALSRSRFPGKDVLDSLLDLPIVVSPIALGAALLVFFNTPAGAAVNNQVLRIVFAVPGIVLAQFTIVSALATRLLKATFDDIDPRYEQVARTLGQNKLGSFFRVTLPLARNGLISAVVLTWARAVGEFGATITLAGATTMKTETLPIAIFLSLSTADVQKAIAVIVILIAIGIIALVIVRRVAAGVFRL